MRLFFYFSYLLAGFQCVVCLWWEVAGGWAKAMLKAGAKCGLQDHEGAPTKENVFLVGVLTVWWVDRSRCHASAAGGEAGQCGDGTYLTAAGWRLRSTRGSPIVTIVIFYFYFQMAQSPSLTACTFHFPMLFFCGQELPLLAAEASSSGHTALAALVNGGQEKVPFVFHCAVGAHFYFGPVRQR